VSDRSGRNRGPTPKTIVAGVLLVLLLIVILQNTADTRLHILFFHVTWPLWLLLAVFAVIAFVAGWFAGRTRN
jgi:uncharacterized integral membrane protein